jgi:tRNA(Ile)-lysidine synthase
MTRSKLISNRKTESDLRRVRPFLKIPRVLLEEVANQEKIPYRTDSTNSSAAILRNRVRHRVIPFLEQELTSAFKDKVLQTVEILRSENDLMEELLKNAAQSRVVFEDLHPALQRRILVRELENNGLTLTFDLVERLRCSPPGTLISCGAGCAQRDVTGKLSHSSPAPDPEFSTARLDVTLNLMKSVEFGGRVFRWDFLSPPTGAEKFVRQTDVEFFDAEKVGERICLRHWQEGDRFQPSGLPSPKKLQDLFINASIPRPQRHQLVVAAAESGTIFWVENLRIGEAFKVTEETGRMLQWKWALI